MADTSFVVIFNNGDVETRDTLRLARDAIRMRDVDDYEDRDVLPARILKDGTDVEVFTTWRQLHNLP